MPGEGLAHRAAYWPAVAALTLGWGFRAAGRRHLPPTGPALIVANHQSYFDPILLGAASPRPLAYLARDTLFGRPAFARLIRAFGAFPIDRAFGREGLQQVWDQLDAGRAVVLFPEGERSPTGELQPLRAGVALLARRLTCPVVPAGIAGAFEAWPRGAKRPRAGGRLAVAFGAPLDPGRWRGAGRGAALAEMAAGIAAAVAEAGRLTRHEARG